MKKLLFIAFGLIWSLCSYAQTTTGSAWSVNVYKYAKVPVSIIMPSGYNTSYVGVELWNAGVKVSGTITPTVSGDTVKFTIPKEKVQALTRDSYFYVRFKSDTTVAPAISGKILTGATVGDFNTITKAISLPNNTLARISIIPDASFILQAITTSTAQAALAKKYKDSTEAILSLSSSYVQTRLKKGTLAQLRANTETIDAYNIIDKVKSGLFYYDASDVTSADDGVMTIVVSGKRYKRQFQEYVNPVWFGAVGDGVTVDNTAMAAAAAYATAKKKTILIESGYRFLITTQINFGCSIEGYGTINTRSGAWVAVTLSGVSVKNIRINGGAPGNTISGKGLYLAFQSRITVDNVKIDSVNSPGMYFRNGIDLKAINSRVGTTRTEYADGIYFDNCVNALADNNTCFDFGRVGIVFENSCVNWQATNNNIRDAFPAILPQFSAGIWGERTKGGNASNNVIENVREKGLIISPNTTVTSGVTYTFTVVGNFIRGVSDAGLGFDFSQDQVLNASNNTFVDCRIGMRIGECNEANINNNIFTVRDSAVSYMRELIRYNPTTISGRKSSLTVSNCKNYVNSLSYPPINITNVSGHKGDLNVIDCNVGNWAFELQPITLAGDINYVNSYLDFSTKGNAQRYIANGINTSFRQSKIVLSKTNNLFVQGTKVEFLDCDISSDSTNHLQFGSFGNVNFRMERSKVNKVKLYNLRTNTMRMSLIDNTFTEYPSEGIFNTVVVSLAFLEARGNQFISTLTTNAPIQLVNGATVSSFGVNGYTSPTLTTGFIPRYEMPVHLTNNGTTSPTKTTLNTTYGSQRAGTTVTYASITGGGKKFRKITDSSTSDWEESLLGTIVP